MATTAEMRAWLRANTGEDIPARGRLDPRWVQMYEDANGTEPQWDGATQVLDDADWDLGDDGTPDPDELEPSVPLEPERAPRTQRAARAERRAQPVTQRSSRFVGKLLGSDTKKKAAAKGKKIPRTSLEKLVTRGYSELGKILTPLSRPMGNCLQAQAAFAGVVLEDTFRDTIVDRALQPLARAEDKLGKVFALTVPPLACLAIEQTTIAVNNGRLDPQQGMMRLALIQPVLRESLRKGLEVSAQYADQIKERLEQDAQWDAEVDKLLAVIFDQPEAEREPEMAGAAA
jgi:hypothetical protein